MGKRRNGRGEGGVRREEEAGREKKWEMRAEDLHQKNKVIINKY